MFTVHVNGRDCRSEKDKSLLRFLRDDLHLTAAKDGCSLRFGEKSSCEIQEMRKTGTEIRGRAAGPALRYLSVEKPGVSVPGQHFAVCDQQHMIASVSMSYSFG